MFGATHVILGGALGLERLVPSAILGLVLGIVCWRSGSIWPSLVQHVLHNTLLLMVGLELGDENISTEWLVFGGLGTCVAFILLWQWGGRAQADHVSPLDT